MDALTILLCVRNDKTLLSRRFTATHKPFGTTVLKIETVIITGTHVHA